MEVNANAGIEHEIVGVLKTAQSVRYKRFKPGRS
jgi:hypothetical protein